MFSTFGAWRAQAKAQLAPPTDSFAGKTVLLTGAKGVICSEVARKLIRLGADTLVLAVRGIPEGPGGEPALDALLGPQDQRPGTRVLVWTLDLLSYDSVGAVAARAAAELPRLDVVVLGAATSARNRRETDEGWEYGMMINHFTHALLVLLLLPILQKSAVSHSTTGVVVEISSIGCRTARPYMPDPPAQPAADGTTPYVDAVNAKSDWASRHRFYGFAKLLFCHFFHELGRRLGPAGGVQLHSCDFGVCDVDEGINTTFRSAGLFMYLFGRPVEMCANVVVNACAAREGSHGAFYVDYVDTGLPNFMRDEAGMRMQRVAWEETKTVLLQKCPEAYTFLLPNQHDLESPGGHEAEPETQATNGVSEDPVP